MIGAPTNAPGRLSCLPGYSPLRMPSIDQTNRPFFAQKLAIFLITDNSVGLFKHPSQALLSLPEI
jgi:hypothetical protein